MNEIEAHRLVELTNEFYMRNAKSFSDTRQSPWHGWSRVLESVDFCGGYKKTSHEKTSDGFSVFRIVDIGCGNLRFEKMLKEKLSDANIVIDAICVDGNQTFLNHGDDTGFASDSLLMIGVDIHPVCADVIKALANEVDLSVQFHIADRDLVVCFAMMHHIPIATWRKRLLDSMVKMTASGGYIALSFWQFSKDARILKKAINATNAGNEKLGLSLDVDKGDYLLGWQEVDGTYRYCHDFSDEEIDALMSTCLRENSDIVEVETFSADGKMGNLNKYVVLKKL